MKYCTKCGNELVDEAVICPSCGCPTELYGKSNNKKSNNNESILRSATLIFMVLGCIANASFLLIPLAWCIPMTIKYYRVVNNGGKLSPAFKVCSLLFVSMIAGILMLVDEDL